MIYLTNLRNMLLLMAAAAVPIAGHAQSQIVPESSGQITSSAVRAPQKISLNLKDATLAEALKEIAMKSGRKVTYSEKVAASVKPITLAVTDITVPEALAYILNGTKLRVETHGQQLVIVEGNSGVQDSVVAKGILTGTVRDSATGEAVEKATVTVAGTSLIATTNREGRYRLTGVPAGRHTVSVRLLGYRTESRVVELASRRTQMVNVTLTATVSMLSDVVTTATGQQRRVEIANDVVKIHADEIRERAPVRNIADMIEAAQVPGILITRGGGDPGSPSKIRMRGLGSISQSNDPVLILDGVWIDAAIRSPSRIDEIDPATIETIEIVRGPSAATLYGQDAANGVIVITTKKGQVGPTRWNFSYSRDWGQPYGTIPPAYQGFGYNPVTNERGVCNIVRAIAFDCIQDSVAVYDPNSSLLAREGLESNNRFVIQMDGGTDAIRYAISGTATTTEGVRRIAPIDLIRLRKLGIHPRDEFGRPSALNRRSISSNLTLLPRSNLTVGLTVSGGQTALKDSKYDMTLPGTGSSPIYRRYSLDTLSLFTSSLTRITTTEAPVHSSTVVFGSNVLWRAGTWTVNSNAGVESSVNDRSSFKAETQCRLNPPCVDTLGSREEASERRRVYTVRLNTSTRINLGSFSNFLEVRPTFGGDFRKTERSRLWVSKNEIPAGDRSISGGVLIGSTYDRAANATAGWYLNTTIGLFKRVYFDAGLRQDIGSAITSSSKTAYPKLGGSWLISDESFWHPNTIVTMLRFRGAFGYAAVQPDPTDIRGLYRSGYSFADGKFVRSVGLTGAGNPNLEPERSAEVELGFDADFLADRISLVATYAHRENKNTLVFRGLPPSAGVQSQRKENIARVRNRNLELSAIARVIDMRDLRTTITSNLTFSDNIVMSLGDGVTPFSNTMVGQIAEGYPLAGIWARRVIGYRDMNDDGLLGINEVILSDSAAYLGWSQPRYRAGYGINISFRNKITFDTRLAYQSRYIQQYTVDNLYGSEDVNASLDEQAHSVINFLNGRRPISDLRWNSASVTYHLPKRVVDMLRARAISASLQGSNLGLWTNYAGRDPGVNANILTSEVPVDNLTVIPRPRTFVLDFKLGF